MWLNQIHVQSKRDLKRLTMKQNHNDDVDNDQRILRNKTKAKKKQILMMIITDHHHYHCIMMIIKQQQQ